LNGGGTSSVPDANSEKSQSKPSLPRRLWKWIDRRTEADKILRGSLDEPIPGGGRFAYVFGSGLLFIFLSQIITGLCLALYYVPSPFAAHASVAYIVKEVAAGSFLRSLHSYGSTAMLVVLLLHFLQTLLYGSYKGKRELLWIAGGTLALLVLGMAFTGYFLSWDQSAYAAGGVGTNIVGEVPFIGNRLRLLLQGGAMLGALTLSRFYVLHVLVIPGLIFSGIAIHIFLFRKAGAAGPMTEDPVKPKLPTETFYPRQVLIDMTFVLVVMGVLGMLAHFVPVMLGAEADPANTRFIPRPEWYFLPMFQWLKYWKGWSTVIGAFIIPAILIGLVFLLPFLDRGLERRPWRRPIPVGGVFIILVSLLWLGMTSRLEDSRDATVAAQLAEQDQQEHAYFYSAFKPYSAPSPSGRVASTSEDPTVAQGKGIFDSHGCSGCHGESGGGAIGPSLKHITAQYPPAQLTALLKAPRANMTAAGMVPLTLDPGQMAALVSYLSSLGGTSAASAAAPPASGSTSPEPGPDVAAGTPKAKAGSSSGDATAAAGKAIFDSNRCSGCHGQSGGGGVGPSLTHITTQYPPAQLTALLKAPRANMKAAGMVPLTLNAADMKALVSYLASLGGTSVASAAAAPSPGSSSPAPAKAKPDAKTEPSKAASAAVPPASGSSSPVPAKAEPDATAEPSKAKAGSSSGDATVAAGKAIFDSNRCSGCHGQSGGGGVGPSLTHIITQYPPAQLTALLKAPRANMKAAGMVPLTLIAADMTALVSYLASLGGAAVAPVAASPASGSPSPAPAKVEPDAKAEPSKAASVAEPPASGSSSPAPAERDAATGSSKLNGEAIFKAHKCDSCHGANGAGGTAPRIAGQNSSYLANQLMRFRAGDRASASEMTSIAKQLDKDQIRAAAAFLASQ
jgi:ubiquinol-cytochrome c reductase cytochrome b subunit